MLDIVEESAVPKEVREELREREEALFACERHQHGAGEVCARRWEKESEAESYVQTIFLTTSPAEAAHLNRCEDQQQAERISLGKVPKPEFNEDGVWLGAHLKLVGTATE